MVSSSWTYHLLTFDCLLSDTNVDWVYLDENWCFGVAIQAFAKWKLVSSSHLVLRFSIQRNIHIDMMKLTNDTINRCIVICFSFQWWCEVWYINDDNVLLSRGYPYCNENFSLNIYPIELTNNIYPPDLITEYVARSSASREY